MRIVPEAIIKDHISREDSFEAVEQVFASMAARSAYNFPVIREAIGHADALYGFKSGFDRNALNLGLKSGGYWPGNSEKGLTNHQSTVFLFDADTGKCSAIVGGNLLTALRTAAAAAVSVAHLARKDAEVLGIVGAGHQASFQLRAVAEQRDFKKVVAWNRSPEKLATLEQVARELGLPFEAVSVEDLCAQSDVIVTITSSFDAIIHSDQVRPGTHIACMGTDTKGKQEVDAALVARSSVFTDEIAQSTTIGEAQHAVAIGSLSEAAIVELGAVINGAHPGRGSADEVTLFDGTGVGLQDLAVAATVVERASKAGAAIDVDF
ncbi:iminosuccinate reductase BhcD [Phaeobacter inhibens]|uniref:iminosuccinate reductase BhcD n=1 Tax=Phaeobacter inhibens TaxID=221822 RepID=UPI00076BB968|nr:iminosuccinate reductase BhcD [Phaeobacter inhibens]KXF92294.1 ornithine cyclodeaminase [Phaeobacter inhibens]WHP68783.1 ornithine cyclodeaminase family protein [Phaeobacter inhibens]